MLAAVAATGCGSEYDQPTDEDYDDVAAAVAPLIANDLGARGSVTTATDMALGSNPAWLSFDGSGAAYGAIGDLSWSFEIRCEDSGGREQTFCDDKTAFAAVDAAVAGTLDVPFVFASLSASGSWRLDGLQSDEVRATGDVEFDAETRVTSPFRRAERTLDVALSANYDVIVPVENPKAVRGDGAAQVEASHTWTGPEGDSDSNFLIDLEVSLDGAGGGSLVLDGSARYELNLDNGTVVRIDL